MSPPGRSRVAPYIPSYLEAGQKCVVCSDEATGLHYRAITCEGCKGFFRRVCQRGLKFTCKEGEKCEINKATRNVCQRCRLLKCLANGMSTDLVLNEVERTVKQRLIERNRERKELERVQAKLRRYSVIENMQHFGDKQTRMISSLTRQYCAHVDVALQMDADFPFQDPSEQFNSLLKELLRRMFCFSSSLSLFSKLNTAEQECLLVKNRGWLEIQFLRTIHQIDLIDGCLISPPVNETGSRLRLSQMVGIETAVQDLFVLADSFQKLQLDNSQLALLSAILIFQPEFLEENAEVAALNDELWSALHYLVEQSGMGEGLLTWPRLHIKVAHLRALTRRHFSAFFEKTNAREFARLFA